MTYTIKINGRTATPEEADAVCKKRNRTFGIADDEFLRSPPLLITDDYEFRTCKSGFAPDELPEFYMKEALKAGVNPHGKRYFGHLADRPGDPKAWMDGRGDKAKRKAERALPLMNDPGPVPRLADDIVQDTVKDMQENNPDAAKRPFNELAHEVRNKYGAHWGNDDSEFNERYQ